MIAPAMRPGDPVRIIAAENDGRRCSHKNVGHCYSCVAYLAAAVREATLNEAEAAVYGLDGRRFASDDRPSDGYEMAVIDAGAAVRALRDQGTER